MLRFLFLLSLIVTGISVTAQAYNTTLRDRLDYTPLLNDVWGYVAPDGTEYALVGLRSGLSIVSLADPDDIREVAFLPGDNSPWRDIKTFGTYAYVVADRGDDGLVVVDLSNLPASATAQSYTANLLPGNDTLKRAHNIYIDEPTGLAYLAGGPRSTNNLGGMILLDVATTPGVPTFVSYAPSTYSHDVYVADGVMYASEIYGGRLTLYDVSDPQDITELGSVITPRSFTHNAWASADGVYAFTTDERANASVAAYDVSDPLDIELLDEFRPLRSLDSNAVPHNVHVIDDYLVISSYTDGVEIVDASDPTNLVEVGYYDTWSGRDGGFNGNWGAYPYLPSGLVLASDMTNGLYVFDVDYKRGARVVGTVTDATTGLVLNGASVRFTTVLGNIVTYTNASGRYREGTGEAGVLNVTFSAEGYEPQTIPVDFQNGQTLTVDVALERSALPVTLVSFTARPRGKTGAALHWTSSQETNSREFVVERSTNGTDFSGRTTVAAAGNSTEPRHYEVLDDQLTESVTYYRLRQVDQDGTFTFSEVRAVVIGASGPAAYPNPAWEWTQLGTNYTGPVTLYAADGRLYRLAATAGRLSLARLPAGSYRVLVDGTWVPVVRQ